MNIEFMQKFGVRGEGEDGEKLVIANRNRIVGIFPTYRVNQTQNNQRTSDSRLQTKDSRQQSSNSKQQTPEYRNRE
jgi:hypothetical protein